MKKLRTKTDDGNKVLDTLLREPMVGENRRVLAALSDPEIFR
nr:hypothetical protein [Paenibacillus lemnae]